MQNNLNWHNNRLSRFLLAYIILCSSFFTLIGTAIQLYNDYRSDIDSIKGGIRHIEQGYLKTLSTSLWALDYGQMKNSLDGAAHLPDIQYLEVREIRDGSENTVSSWGEKLDNQVIKQVFPLHYGNSKKQIGSLLVIASTDKVMQRLKAKLLLILLTQGIKTFLVSLCILIIFHRLIMRHLISITSYFSSFDLNRLDESLSINRRLSKPRKSDLFESLVNSINRMRLRLKENLDARIANQQEVNRLKNQLQNIVDSMPAILIGLDKNGKVIHWNRSAEKETGKQPNEVEGKLLVDVFPPLGGQTGLLKKVLEYSYIGQSHRITRLMGDKTVFWDVMAYPLNTNGEEGVVVRIEDVTEKERINQLMVQTEKMISVGGIAAGIAHEINNPLSGIITGIQNTMRRMKPTLKKNREVADPLNLDLYAVNEYLEKREILKNMKGVEEAGKRAAKIVSNMLSFSRKSESTMAPVELGRLVNNTIELANIDYDLKKKYDFRHIKIIKEIEPEQITLMGLETEIEQVLLNLLKNAAEAIFDGGKEEHPLINIRAKLDEEKVRIEIEDNGPGMNNEQKKRLFEPFYTTKPVGRGTGLGLSVSYLIITRNHQGTMEVESKKGKGTKFIIHLPLKYN
jgi:PAS domain S-box-containing protein